MRGVFVTGTDTDVGKTVASACLVRALGADYWKPVQSGTDDLPEGDAGTVAALAGIGPERIVPTVLAYKAPLSPDQAAALEGASIDLDAVSSLPSRERPVVVEGAGGVLVPLTETATMLDLMQRLALPVVVVARSGLGTINHTLLTLEALDRRGLEVAGVILVGPPKPMNRDAIIRFGGCTILGELPHIDPLTPEAVADLSEHLTLEALSR
ncbi:dethiobiotin synthase [Caenispirillum salinarum]|uniref:dethiobiotin synthase n=1 Tax=Caenispirillum salinarum TaxID=859058 RepID=UPI0038518040